MPQIATYNQVVRQHEYKTKVDCGTISPAEARQDHYPFYLLEWGRLIADESHSMRSPTGKTAAACWALQAGKALLLSATPAQVRAFGTSRTKPLMTVVHRTIHAICTRSSGSWAGTTENSQS